MLSEEGGGLENDDKRAPLIFPAAQGDRSHRST